MNAVKVPSRSVQTAAAGVGGSRQRTCGLGFLKKRREKALTKKQSPSHKLEENEPWTKPQKAGSGINRCQHLEVTPEKVKRME